MDDPRVREIKNLIHTLNLFINRKNFGIKQIMSAEQHLEKCKQKRLNAHEQREIIEQLQDFGTLLKDTKRQMSHQYNTLKKFLDYSQDMKDELVYKQATALLEEVQSLLK